MAPGDVYKRQRIQIVALRNNMIYDILLQKLKRSPGYGAEKDVI